MDLNYSQDESAFRDEVRGWLKANLPQDLRDKIASYAELGREDLLRWHKILARKGWVAPSWRFDRLESVRTRQKIQSAKCPSVVQIFWPLTI